MSEPLKTVGPFILIPPFKQQIMTEDQQRAYDQAQVMLAFSQGKKVECKNLNDGDWTGTPGPTWSWKEYDYRIAPEPQEVWLWVKEGKDPLQLNHSCHVEHLWVKDGYTKKLFREVLP